MVGRSVGSSVCCADCLVSCSVGCVGCSAGSRLLGRPVVLSAAWSVVRLVARSVVSVVRSFVLVAQPLVRSVVRAVVSVVRSGDRSVVGQLFGGLFARWFIWRSGRLFHRSFDHLSRLFGESKAARARAAKVSDSSTFSCPEGFFSNHSKIRVFFDPQKGFFRTTSPCLPHHR